MTFEYVNGNIFHDVYFLLHSLHFGLVELRRQIEGMEAVVPQKVVMWP